MILTEEKMLKLAETYSDHKRRITSEIGPPLRELSKRDTLLALEVGNREGGSAIVILYYLQHVPRSWFITVDVGPCPPLITEWVEKLGIPHKHWKMTQAEYFDGPAKVEMAPGQTTVPYGFVFLDADHGQSSCSADIRKLTPSMEKGGVIAVDDVDVWQTLPEFEGLERVNYEGVDQGDFKAPSHGHHIAYWRKT
jgi:predicted O-methyltransferase YrrM